MQGGEIEAKGMSSLSRNRMQIPNYRRVENKKNNNVLYSVMLECKLSQGTKEALSVMLRLPLTHSAFFFFDSQISDMERFYVTVLKSMGF